MNIKQILELFNEQNLPTAEDIYNDPFIINNYLKNYTLKDIDGDLVYVDNKTGEVVSGYIRLDPEDLYTLEQALSRDVNETIKETYINFKKLNEELTKFLEGDVVSFADYKNKKILNTIEKEMKTDIVVGKLSTIKIKSISREDLGLKSGENYSPIEAQAYFNAIRELAKQGKIDDKKILCDYEVSILFNSKGDEKGKDDEVGIYKLDAELVGGGGAFTIELAASLAMEDELHKQILLKDIGGDYLEVPESLVQEKINEITNNLNTTTATEVEEDLPMLKPQGYGKKPEEVAVGDILSCEWGYSMNLVDFYKVLERKKSSIKVARLETKKITDDGFRGKEYPVDRIKSDRGVDGKLFRIVPPNRQHYNRVEEQAVIKIKGNDVRYWNGTALSFDELD